MKLTRAIPFIMAAVAFLASSQAAVAQDWHLATSKACVAKGQDVYCLINGDFKGQSARVVVKSSTVDVSFRYQEWHSTCGISGTKVQSEQFSIIHRGEELPLKLLDPGLGVTCREAVITDCKVNGGPIQCSSVLSVVAQSFIGNRQ